MLKTSLGRLLVDEALPEALRGRNTVLDKNGLNKILSEVATQYPERYRDVVQQLSDIGRRAASESGGYSVGPEHLNTAKAARKYQTALRTKLKHILDDDSLTDKQRDDAILRAAGAMHQKMIDEVYDESVREKNPLAMQVLSGSRGNKANVTSLRGSDLLYSDHRDRPIPVPIFHSYSEGLRPFEYVTGAYGARRGILGTKLSVRDAGALSKQLNQINHRLVVVGDDDPRDLPDRGFPVDVDDQDSVGSLLAKDVGPYRRNTPITSKILADLKRRGIKQFLLRSPAVGGSPEGGVYAYDVGVGENGRLVGRGQASGMTAAQSIIEPISQGTLGLKHGGGVAGQNSVASGFDYIEQLVSSPKHFKGRAAHADKDGQVSRIEAAPAGGHYVWVDDQKHYVGSGLNLKVKIGDTIEAGDVLSEGAPDVASVVKHKGIGEGRRYFTYAFRQAVRDAGIKSINRRNVELLSRGLVNHVRMTDEFGGHVPEDVVPYATLEHAYEPREGHRKAPPQDSIDQYLERPILHYTVGTRVRPSVAKMLENFGINEVITHPEPPPFESTLVRGSASLQHDPDWMARMYGSGLKGSLLDAAHRGGTSDEAGTSFVPSLARGVDFGRSGLVRQPETGRKPPPEGEPFQPAPIARPATFAPVSLPKEPKRKSMFGGLFKWSKAEECRTEAVRALVKVAARLAVPVPELPKAPTPDTPPQAPHIEPQSSKPTGTANPWESFVRRSSPIDQPPNASGHNPLAGYMPAVQNDYANRRPDFGIAAFGPAATPPSAPIPQAVAETPTPSPAAATPQNGYAGQLAARTPLQSAGMAAVQTPQVLAAGYQAARHPIATVQAARAIAANPTEHLLARSAKPVAGSLGRTLMNPAAGSVILNAAANLPNALGNFAALDHGQEYDWNAHQWYEDLAKDLGQSNALERAFTGLTRPISTIAAGAAAAPQVIDSRADMEEANFRNNRIDQAVQRHQAPETAQLAAKHQRWLQAVREGHPPQSPWTDPVTGTPYTNGEYQDYLAREARKGQTPFERDTKGLGWVDRLFHRLAS